MPGRSAQTFYRRVCQYHCGWVSDADRDRRPKESGCQPAHAFSFSYPFRTDPIMMDPVMKLPLSYSGLLGPQVQAPAGLRRWPLRPRNSHPSTGQHIGHAQPNPWARHLRAGCAAPVVTREVTGWRGLTHATVDLCKNRLQVQCRFARSSAEISHIRVTAIWLFPKQS